MVTSGTKPGLTAECEQIIPPAAFATNPREAPVKVAEAAVAFEHVFLDRAVDGARGA